MFLWMSLWENSHNLVACHGQARFFCFLFFRIIEVLNLFVGVRE